MVKKFYYSDLSDYEVSAQEQENLSPPEIREHRLFSVEVKRNGECVDSLISLEDEVLGLVRLSLVRGIPDLDTVIGRILLIKREDLS